MSLSLEDFEIPPMQCGDFSCAIGWNMAPGWNIAGGVAAFVSIIPPPDAAEINHLYNYVVDSIVTVTFTITNWSFALPSPASDFEIWVDANQIGAVNGNGTYTVLHKVLAGDTNLRFIANASQLGDAMDLDDIVMEDAARYAPLDLGFFLKYGVTLQRIDVDATKNMYNYVSNYQDIKILIEIEE